MKKEVRLYNVIFPFWFMLLAWPALVYWPPGLALVMLANFAIDSLVLAVAAWRLRLPEKFKLWRRSIWMVWLLGLLCDAAGALLVAGLYFLVEGGVTARTMLFPGATLYALPGVALAGVLLYWLNRLLSFRKTGLEKRQLHKLCLAIALFTAPYLMLIPLGF